MFSKENLLIGKSGDFSFFHFRCLSFWLLFLIVTNCGLNCIFCKHRAMKFDWWKFEMRCYVLIPYFDSILNQHSFQYFSSIRTTCDGRATSESFEDRFINLTSLFIYLNLKFHDVTTGWSTHETSAYILIFFVQRTNVSWVFVVIQYVFMISKHANWLI